MPFISKESVAPVHIWSLLREIQCWHLFICCCLSSLLFLCFVIFPLRENWGGLYLLDILKDLCRSLSGSRNEIQNRLNRSSGTALTSMLYNKVGGFFKSLQMTVIISSTMSVMTHSQEHDTQLVAAGERERERETFHQISLQVWIFCICSKLHYT